MPPLPRRALFWDRDGTLIVHRPYLCDPAGVELMPGVRDTLIRALADGFMVFLLTNSKRVRAEFFTLREVEAGNQRMFELLHLPAPGFTGTCVAPESADAPVNYRKPSPKYILEMKSEHELDPGRSWMIGDSISDVQAGLNAGIRAAWVDGPKPADLPAGVWRFPDVSGCYERLSLEP